LLLSKAAVATVIDDYLLMNDDTMLLPWLEKPRRCEEKTLPKHSKPKAIF
jgi:hypothetical protein